MRRVFVVPKNDAESTRIIEILKERKEIFLVTSQSWGASWENLEEEIKVEIEEILKKFQFLAQRTDIYGIELKGKALNFLCKNIDHHHYHDDDRRNEKSSLEQVAELISYQMTNYDKMISANDTGYISAMKSLNIDITDSERGALIIKVRALDRKAQGIKEVQEQQSIKAIENLEKIKDTIIIKSEHSKCSCYTDRLFGEYKRLLIISEDGEQNFYGDKKTIEKLFKKIGGWKGGEINNNNGYWGGYANQEDVEKIVKEFL